MPLAARPVDRRLPPLDGLRALHVHLEDVHLAEHVHAVGARVEARAEDHELARTASEMASVSARSNRIRPERDVIREAQRQRGGHGACAPERDVITPSTPSARSSAPRKEQAMGHDLPRDPAGDPGRLESPRSERTASAVMLGSPSSTLRP
jgi:hypothetical protein